MNQTTRIAGGALAVSVLAGCGSIVNGSSNPSAPFDDGLSGSEEQFNRMTGPCVDQAARLTGLDRRSIGVLDRIRTGGGPLLTMSAGGTKYSCRLEDNGRVTVFSEYAN